MRVIAEIGSPPSLEWALAAAEAAADAGVWAVKGQLLRPHTLVTRTAPAYHHPSIDAPALQWDGFAEALPYEAWAEVKDRCDELGVEWFASCWDEAAVDFCEELGVEWYKVGSGDITHRPLLERIAATGKRIILSTGASTEAEIRRAWEWIEAQQRRDFDEWWNSPGPHAAVPFGSYRGRLIPVLMACTLSYPCVPGDANVRRVETLRRLLGGEVGYSDHTYGWHAGQIARTGGAAYLEKHFTVTPGAGGDHDFAATPSTLAAMMGPGLGDQPEWAHFQPEWGDGRLEPMPCEQPARINARRSIAANRDLPQGSIINPGDLTYLRPGTGIPPFRTDDVVGLALPIDVPAGTLLPADLLNG